MFVDRDEIQAMSLDLKRQLLIAAQKLDAFTAALQKINLEVKQIHHIDTQRQEYDSE